MRAIHFCFAVSLFVASAGMFLYTLATLTYTKENQIYKLNSDEIKLLKNASIFIQQYDAENSHLPDPSEVSTWMQHKDSNYEGWGYSYQKAPFQNLALRNLGSPPPKAYILSFWQGDFFVQYPSWYGDGKLAYIPDSEYFKFGSELADLLIFSSTFIVLFTLGVFEIKKIAN